jgi:hypothetical protein
MDEVTVEQTPLTLVVETPQGTVIRRVPDATPLPEGAIQGYAAEDATRTAAARWGLPDFVFPGSQQRQGSSVRELSDGLLLVSERGAVLQIKSRTEPTDDGDKETRWLAKNITKAHKQAVGTVRNLINQPAELVNARGRAITVAGADYIWLSVVVIDHPAPPPGFTPPRPESSLPSVVVLRREWEFLFDHLRSTRAVLDYLVRAAQTPLELGLEVTRYHEYALADLATEPSPRSPDLDYAGEAIVDSTPRAPLHPAGHDDSRAHLLLRVIMEDIAATPLPSTSGEVDRLWALGELDGLPVASRTELGHAMLEFMDRIAALSGEGFFTETRTVLPNPGEFCPMVFMVASESSEEARQALFLKTQLTHYDYYAATAISDGTTVGIMLAPSSHPSRIWDTSLSAAQGDQGHSPENIARLRAYLTQQTYTG